MKYDFQRASMLKRAPAWLLDMILWVTLLTGFLWGLSFVFNVTPHFEEINTVTAEYEQQYGGKLSYSTEEYEKMTEAEKKAADEISLKIDQALSQDSRSLKARETIITYCFALVSLSTLGAYLILDFLVPLLFKNGQTLGKKCFGVALMRQDGVKVTPFMMFARTVLGKCTVETMLPAMMFILAMLGAGGLMLILSLGILLAQIIIPLVTRNKTAIHDLMACTVAVDLSSQMIFDTPEEMEAYHNNLYADKAEPDSE